MTRRQKRLISILVVLALLIMLIGGYFWYYSQTKKLSLDLITPESNTVVTPQFLFSFSGQGFDRLQRPIGVLVSDGRVYVSDSVRSRIFTFNEDGDPTGSFGESQTVNPLYMDKNPKDGAIYVTDRRKYTIFKYSLEGKYLGEFKPQLPKSQLPSFESYGVEWQPIALAFGPDGTLYVTEILNGHRLLIFGPDGKFKRSIGTAGIVTDPNAGPEVFQFPNGIMVFNGEVFVADSNNQRVKVYTPEGEYKRLIVTRGLPRGMAPLLRFPGDETKTSSRFVSVDTLAHDVTIWTTAGEKLLNFGEQGVLDGQFSYPGAVSRGTKNRLFIADTANGRVQVWGWPAQAAGVPTVSTAQLPLCLLPLLLLPLLLLLRKKEFFATADFVEELIAREAADSMPHRRRRWVTSQAQYEIIAALKTETVDMAELFSAVDYSESDVVGFVDKYELDREMAIDLAIASRSKVAGTQSDELRRLAKMLEIDVVSAAEFIERFVSK